MATKATTKKAAAKKPAGKVRRTTMRSSKGTKLYAVRNADGSFKDIQTYKRAHGADIKRNASKETSAKAKAAKAKKPKAPAKKA